MRIMRNVRRIVDRVQWRMQGQERYVRRPVGVIEEKTRVQPIVQFAQATLGQIDERFIKAIEAMPEEALNWQPGDETTNSLAQIVRHVAAGRTFMLGIALGQPLPTFTGLPDARARGLHNDPATHAELTDMIREADAQWKDHLTALDATDLTEVVPSPFGEPRARFFWIAANFGEAREHIGHAELTVQMYQRYGAHATASTPA